MQGVANHQSAAVRMVERRMAQLGLDMKSLSLTPGAPSYNAVRFFLHGTRETRPQTLRKLEIALDLDPGSLGRAEEDVTQTDDLSLETIRVGGDVVVLPADALDGLDAAGRAELIHHLISEAYARSAAIRGRQQRG